MLSRVLIGALLVLTVAGCSGDTAAGTTTRAARLPERTPPVVSEAAAETLRLTRALPDQYRQVCEQQAAYAPADARTCPPLIPMGALKVETAGPFSRQHRYRGGYSTNFASRSLDRLGGKSVETNGGHWRYDVTWKPNVKRLAVVLGVERPPAADKPSRCRQTTLGGQRAEVCRVVRHERGGGLNGGHIAYVWDDQAVTYMVSVHGYANQPRARAMMMALIAKVLG
jgi:hypothetical protein